MEIYTSYFYQIRFFTEDLIPLSTAKWDPKWFHNFKNQNHYFFDKRKILNGLRIPLFVPGKNCDNLCKGKNCNLSSKDCLFLKEYQKQLNNLNFEEVINFLQNILDNYKKLRPDIIEPKIVLIVYETPDNPCSERKIIQNWFKENNINIREWRKDEKTNYI